MSNAYLPPEADVTDQQDFENPPLFSTDGRVGRVRYLAHTLWITTAIQVVALLILSVTDKFNEALTTIITLVMLLAVAVVALIFGIKRCHDFNKSGWWSILTFVPFANLILIFIPGKKTANNYGPVPGPNTVWVWLGALLLPLFFIVGVLAAIAIPAYEDYTTRAQIGATMVPANQIKTRMIEHYETNGSWPAQLDLEQLGLDAPLEASYASLQAMPNTGDIVVTLYDVPTVSTSAANGTLLFSPRVTGNGVSYDCESKSIQQHFLGSFCTGL